MDGGSLFPNDVVRLPARKDRMTRWLVLLLALTWGTASADETRLAFGSCAKLELPQPIWQAVVDWKPDAFVTLGDIVYANTEDMDQMRSMYALMDTVAGFRRLRESCPLYGVWDDHDYGMRDGDASYPQREAAQGVFLDFLAEPDSSQRRMTPGVYDAVYLDELKRVQLILLDVRYFRSAWEPDTSKGRRYRPARDPKRTMLGEAQWKWLEEQLQLPAEVRIIGSGIQVLDDEHGFECWGQFPLERDRLFQLIRNVRANGVLFVSGDRHFAELSRMDAGVGYPIYDLTSSGLTHVVPDEYVNHNAKRIGEAFNGFNFGTIEVNWDEPDPKISLRIHDVDGNPRRVHVVPLSHLQFP
jgi:alkaline phosphatase D